MRPAPEARPIVLDAGALIALESRDRRAATIIQRARSHGALIHIPAGALAQAWRDGARQARLAALLGREGVSVADLTGERAKAAGELCAKRRTSDPIDASVVILARQVRGLVLTSDPDD